MTRSTDAQERAPLRITMLFAPVFAAVTLLHITLLRLPYYWDEGGYYIPAAWDFFRLGTVIPVTTVRNAHPPLPSVLLAAWWKVSGFHILSTRLLMCVVTTFALLAVFKLARMFVGQAAAIAVLVLTAIYPVWFAQSTLAHADMFAAAFTAVGTVLLCRPARVDVVCFAFWYHSQFCLGCCVVFAGLHGEGDCDCYSGGSVLF